MVGSAYFHSFLSLHYNYNKGKALVKAHHHEENKEETWEAEISKNELMGEMEHLAEARTESICTGLKQRKFL